MPAKDHLGSQFEIVHPHRAVRIGSKVYPAVRTMYEGPDEHSPSTATAAWIPAENGSLTRVAHFSDSPGEYHLLHSHQEDQAKFIIVHGGQNREQVHGADAVHQRLEIASTRHLSSDEIIHNKARIDFHRARIAKEV